METYYASPERADENKLAQQVDVISNNPIINALMNLTGGLMAVLNEQRQVISLNQHFLKLLGIENPDKVLGGKIGFTTSPEDGTCFSFTQKINQT